MQVAIFDLDGTLTRTTRVDEACYLRAVREEFHPPSIDSDWSNYTHSTDSGITAELFQRHFGRAPTEHEVARFRRRFVSLLALSFRTEPDSCTAIVGASAALQRLRAHSHWGIALATGSWRDSAVLKIKTAGLALGAVPAAFADDSHDRADIIALARSRALAQYGQADFARTVYVGDAPWDVRAARRLRVPFLGVGEGRGALRLRHEGASEVIKDFADFARVLRALESVAAPRVAL